MTKRLTTILAAGIIGLTLAAPARADEKVNGPLEVTVNASNYSFPRKEDESCKFRIRCMEDINFGYTEENPNGNIATFTFDIFNLPKANLSSKYNKKPFE